MNKLIALIFLLPLLGIAQVKINGNFSPPEDFSYIFLYKANPLSSDFVTRTEVDREGNFTMESDSLSEPGLYKIVYAMPPERYNFELIVDAKENISFEFNEENGLEFSESDENKMWHSYIETLAMISSTISNYYSKDGKDIKSFQEIFKALADFQTAYEKNSEGMLVHSLIKSSRPYIPVGYQDVSTYLKNLKNTYLNNIDFGDSLVQSSGIIKEKVMSYVFYEDNQSQEQYESKISAVTFAIEEIDPLLQLKTLLPIWEYFTQTGNDVMANHLIDFKLMQLAKTTGQDVLIEAFTNFQNNAIGSKASNFNLGNGKSLYDLTEAENYLLIFWSSSCGHCLEELPKVYESVKNNNGLKTIAFGIEDNAETWQAEIKKYPGFIHVYGAGKWDNETVLAYGVNATPSYIMLDSDKNIVAKPFDYEALRDYLKNISK